MQIPRENKKNQQESKAYRLRLAKWRDRKYQVPNNIIKLLAHLNLKLASIRTFCYVGKKLILFSNPVGKWFAFTCRGRHPDGTAHGRSWRQSPSFLSQSLFSFHYVLIVRQMIFVVPFNLNASCLIVDYEQQPLPLIVLKYFHLYSFCFVCSLCFTIFFIIIKKF